MMSLSETLTAPTVRERPILFAAPLVRAILDGKKTQTRRLIKPQPTRSLPHTKPINGGDSGENWTMHHPLGWKWQKNKGWSSFVADDADSKFVDCLACDCPFGRAGDRLWVKETWRPRIAHSHGEDACDCADVTLRYEADGAERFVDDRGVPHEWMMPKAAARGNVSPLLMPRWASRITLEITNVRVQRLQDISEEDARAEGATRDSEPCDHKRLSCEDIGCMGPGYRSSFAQLWSDLNGREGPLSWAANPFVWVIDFRRLP